MKPTEGKPNRLHNEKSPYLLQHAYNPVDWYAWSDEAFAKAKSENKPIFLSIGYSTCHWCHVMEKESFEDEEVAALLNRHFVAIKVDREERPDIDQVYMGICQAMTGQGGWPLTIVMAPDARPYFAATYIPKEQRYGRQGLMEILPQLAVAYTEQRERIEDIGERIVKATQAGAPKAAKEEPSSAIFERAFSRFQDLFDADFGGFGQAPKFPTPHQLMFLLRYGVTYQAKAAQTMAEKTLQVMAISGLWDHVGYGFARYSTDRMWLVPHFEKMLYDQAMLLHAYLDAYEVTGIEGYRSVAALIVDYVTRELQSAEGLFFSAQDADSEGEEGKFYVFSKEEVVAYLGEEDGHFLADAYGMSDEGNFEGKNILHRLGLPSLSQEEIMRLDSLRQKLFTYREQRIKPSTDDKCLTSWNALMISALAKAYRVTKESRYLAIAQKAEQAITNLLIDASGRLMARYRDGEVRYKAYLDDYAFLALAKWTLYEATYELRYLAETMKLINDMVALFEDTTHGGFFFTGHDAEQLLFQAKEAYDGAIPSGNSVAFYVMAKVASVTGDLTLRAHLDRHLKAFYATIENYPIGYTFYLMGLMTFLLPTKEIVLVAHQKDDPTLVTMLSCLEKKPLMNATIIVKTMDNDADLANLVPMTADHTMIDGVTTAYVCEGFACKRPVTTVEALQDLL